MPIFGNHKPLSLGALIISVTGIIIASLMFFASNNAINLAVYYTPLIDAIMELKLQVARSGDLNPDAHSDHPKTDNCTLRHLHNADWYANAMLNGKVNLHNDKNINELYPALLDPDLRQKTLLIQDRISLLIKHANKKQEALSTDNNSYIIVNQKDTAVYNEIYMLANSIEGTLLSDFSHDLAVLKVSRIILISAVIVFSILSALRYTYYYRRRAYAEDLLQKSNKQLQSSQGQLQNVIKGANLGYWDWNYQTSEFFVNDKWLDMIGLDRKDFNNHINDWSKRIHPDDMYKTITSVEKHIAIDNSHQVEFRMKHRDGHWVWIQCSGAAVEYDDAHNAVRLCGTHQDITERKAIENQLNHLASHDQLTGLHNRRAFVHRLEEELNRASRYNKKLSIFMIDIDHFKKINDRYEHKAGDHALMEFSRLLTNSMRTTDFTSRYGGEEFTVILPETASSDAKELAERFRLQLSKLQLTIENGLELSITISIGIATFPDHGATSETLINAADSALYISKNKGRNMVTLAGPSS